MNLLIPYIQLPDHSDPLFDEFTYGDNGSRGKKLATLVQGGHVFFHTTSRGEKIIRAYYVVDRVLSTVEACSDERIRLKYNNHHLTFFNENGRPLSEEHDYVLFGDPILSNVLHPPIKFDRHLAEQLSLGIVFRSGRTDSQTISSATRSWRNLTAKDVKRLFAAAHRAAAAKTRADIVRSTEEVAETIEKDIEDHLARNPSILGKGLLLKARQLVIRSGRVDLLFHSPKNELLLVEVKHGKIGRDAISQLEGYMADIRSVQDLPVRGAIVCGGVMPAYEQDISKKKHIAIFIYGWKLDVERWQRSSA